MTYTPHDHLPQSLRDDSQAKAEEAIEHLKALYAHASRVARGLATLIDRQRHGGLSRSEAAVLSRMVLANLRAAARGELHYRPGRAALARDTGYSERTVSKALTRLKSFGLIEAARYAKGGRIDKHGLATEWRSGGLDNLLVVLRGLGYRVEKSIAETVTEAVNWVRAKLSKHIENVQENPIPTRKSVPGTLVCNSKGNLDMAERVRLLAARAASVLRASHDLPGRPRHDPPASRSVSCDLIPTSGSLGEGNDLKQDAPFSLCRKSRGGGYDFRNRDFLSRNPAHHRRPGNRNGWWISRNALCPALWSIARRRLPQKTTEGGSKEQTDQRRSAANGSVAL